MSQPSQNYCNKVERWILGGVPLERMNFRPEQRFRAHLVTEVYQHWIAAPHIDPRKMLQNFSQRDYAFLLKKAREGDAEAQELVEALHITANSTRSANEISNDVYLLNYLVGKLSTSKKHIHRMMYESNIEWMQNFGRKTGTWQAVKQANQDLAKLNNDFKDEENPQDQMPSTNINITGDVSIIKKGRQSLSDEERERLRKKYGLTDKEMSQQLEEINGVWQAPETEEEEDIFEKFEDKD